MKKLLLFLFLQIIIFPQKRKVGTIQYQQETHQYVVEQAWQLLIYEHPEMQLSSMALHLGNYETGGPFTSQNIMAGAFREDEEDLVYGHSLGLITINHFWDADAGDNSKMYFFPNYMHNAYQKAKVFIYGTDDEGNRRICVPLAGYWPDFVPYPSYTTGWFLAYDSLFDLLKTGKYYWDGYLDVAGDPHFTHQGPFYMSEEDRNAFVWEILGRVSHLLTDMAVPAHVHNDIHYPNLDYYEETMTSSFSHNWSYVDAINQGGLINVNTKYDPLRYLFYTTNQITDFFPSDDVSGDANYTSTYYSDYYAELNDIITNLGTPPPKSSIPTIIHAIANTSFVTSIRTVAGLLYWFANETEIIPPLPTVLPTSKNVGTIKGTSLIEGSFTIFNNGTATLSGNITTTNPNYDLDYINTPYVYEDVLSFSIAGGESFTVNYKGIAPLYAGPFTEVFSINTNIGYNTTYSIIGNIALPDFCFAETAAMAASPEEQIFDEAFVGYSSVYSDSIAENDKTIKEKLKFAYKLLNEPTTEKVENICKKIIQKYPKSEMGISLYALGLLWDAALSDEAPEFNEEDFITYLNKLTKSKDKYKINGYAQLLLSLFEIDKTTNGLELLMEEYGYDDLSELSLFYKFIHYYVYKKNNDTARNILSELDEMFEDSKYGYQAHLMLNDEGYTLEGLKLLMKKKESNYLFAKSNSNGNGIFEEIPTDYELFNNYPNPFNPSTTIKYSVPKNSNVKVRIFNMMGQLIKTLVNESKSPGNYEVQWYGKNEENLSVASGIYFYQLESENFVKTNKMILLK